MDSAINMKSQIELQSTIRHNDHFISNQLEPNRIQLFNLQKALKSNEEYINCPYCKKSALTQTKKTISKKSAFLCCVTAGIPWAMFQFFRGKDLNCFDTEHFCSKCSQHIVNYKSLS